MNLLEYYEGLAAAKRALRAESPVAVPEARTLRELRSQYFVLNYTEKAMGVNRAPKRIVHESLREGVTLRAYYADMERLFPKDYARLCLESAKADYPACYESKGQYRKHITEIAKRYELSAKEVKPCYAV